MLFRSVKALPANEKELLKWAIENSKDAKNIRQDHLMTHEEFKEMWNDLCPDTVQQLKDNIAKINSKPNDDEMYLALDHLLFIVEDIDAADWFADLHGYDAVVPLLNHNNVEIRMAAAWIISYTLQNNPKVQKKYFNQYGMKYIMEAVDKETVEKPMTRKFSLVANAIRGSKDLKKQFYELNGLETMKKACQVADQLYFRFCWMIGAILDEEDKEDKLKFKESGIKSFLEEHKKIINDDEMYNNVISRL